MKFGRLKREIVGKIRFSYKSGVYIGGMVIAWGYIRDNSVHLWA